MRSLGSPLLRFLRSDRMNGAKDCGACCGRRPRSPAGRLVHCPALARVRAGAYRSEGRPTRPQPVADRLRCGNRTPLPLRDRGGRLCRGSPRRTGVHGTRAAGSGRAGALPFAAGDTVLTGTHNCRPGSSDAGSCEPRPGPAQVPRRDRRVAGAGPPRGRASGPRAWSPHDEAGSPRRLTPRSPLRSPVLQPSQLDRPRTGFVDLQEQRLSTVSGGSW